MKIKITQLPRMDYILIVSTSNFNNFVIVHDYLNEV